MMFELVARGWVCVSINYRLSPRPPGPITSSTSSGPWPGSRSTSSSTGATRARRHQRGLGRRPPERPAALTAGDPAFQPGFEDVDTSVAGVRPVLRGHGHDRARPRARATTARDSSRCSRRSHEELGRRASRVFEAASPTTGSTPTPRPSSCSRGQRHPGAGPGRPHLRRATARRVHARPSPTPSSPWPSTPSTSSPRCAAATASGVAFPRGAVRAPPR